MKRHALISSGTLLTLLVGAYITVSVPAVEPSPVVSVLMPARIDPPREEAAVAVVDTFAEQLTTLVFTGDIMLSRDIGQLMERKNDWRLPFLYMEEFLRGADVTFGNLEGPISTRGVKVGSIYSFRADPRSVEGLLQSGFDVLSVANNHMWDYGKEALEDTLVHLADAGIGTTGAGYDEADAHRPFIQEVNGVKVALLAYSDFSNNPAIASSRDSERMKQDIASAKAIADIVVASFHWGDEYKTVHNKRQEQLAYIAVDAGADLIIGHHPHSVQDDEWRNNSYIAYSLGNFVFDQNFSEETSTGLVLKVSLKDKKLAGVEKITVHFNSAFQPLIKSE